MVYELEEEDSTYWEDRRNRSHVLDCMICRPMLVVRIALGWVLRLLDGRDRHSVNVPLRRESDSMKTQGAYSTI